MKPTTEKQTPTPWKATELGDFGKINIVQGPLPVAFLGTKRPREENEANAELIVRAVNALQPSIEAMQSAVEELKLRDGSKLVIDELEAALALAKGSQ